MASSSTAVPSGPQSGPAALRVESLSVSYGALQALRDVTWECNSGEIVGLIGPNGAGKSSCFDAITNMVDRSGRVTMFGEDISGVPAWDLAPRGLRRTFQQNAFFTDIPVLHNMTGMLLRSHGTALATAVFAPWIEGRRRRKAASDARDILQRFAVPEEFHHSLPSEIPYGVQRMLSVALAYADGARVLLLDEPGAGLGGADMSRLKDLLIELRASGVALVVIEHHMDLIMTVADRIAVLDQGGLLSVGTPDEVRANPKVLDAYLGGVD